MPKTWFDLGVNVPAESWRTIRSLRADPPPRIQVVLDNEKGRRNTFQMSLEQAQQQFYAATNIGYESRPLNLFYGLAQAGRAIAAASALLGKVRPEQAQHAWEANGHGISFVPEANAKAGLFQAIVRTKPTGHRDLYSRVSEALGRPNTPLAAPLGQVLSQLPEFEMEFGSVADWLPPLTSDGISNSATATDGPHGLDIELNRALRGRPLDNISALRILRQYPAIRDFELWLGHDDELVLGPNATQVKLKVPSISELKLSTSRFGHVPKETTTYRGQSYLFPTVGSGDNSLHPLLSWWVVLYALSMAARYSPQLWMTSLSIGSSPIASQLEFVMDTALSAVPELIAEAIAGLDHCPT